MDNSRLKFRAWNTEKNEWLYLPETGDIELTQYIGNSFEFSYDKEAVVILQYTGLKDKNGKEIYEGDFIEVMGVFYQIVWRGIGFWFMDTHTKELFVFDPQVYHLEVVGNIYESPELLEAVNND